jgi:hypothetical protein
MRAHALSPNESMPLGINLQVYGREKMATRGPAAPGPILFFFFHFLADKCDAPGF